jgi:hypothetical protein
MEIRSSLIGLRTAAAIRPFTQEAGVIDQVATAACCQRFEYGFSKSV